MNWLLDFRKFIIIASLGAVVLLLSLCGRDSDRVDMKRFAALKDSVGYVGMDACRSCHSDIYDTYHQTGMGRSFGAAHPQRSDATFGPHALVYDSISNFWYKPYWMGDSLMVKEFRLDGTDTIHQRDELIAWIIGSGHHTNSHLLQSNGYLYQAPITFYTQKGVWDLAPGFEGGFNSRFGRLINMECLSCHNGLPAHVPGSVNKYAAMPQGIDCERCHGPGEAHVKAKLAGERVDTSKYVDYTIINPKHLSMDLQMQLCQRCHLQGVAVLNEGKGWDDFIPGMHLKEVMQVFLPRFAGAGAEEQFLMASHAERLRESNCFKLGELSCITCHNPHQSVQVSGINTFNLACNSCHGGGKSDSCRLPYAQRIGEGNNCSGCHMPKSGSIDIPHVAITDHNIRVVHEQRPNFTTDHGRTLDRTLEFLGLVCMTEERPSPLTMARGYLRFYEGFSEQQRYLDSAGHYLKQSSDIPVTERLVPQVHYHYLAMDYVTIRNLTGSTKPESITDGHTALRIGDAYMEAGMWPLANAFLERAAKLSPFDLDIHNRLGSVQIYQGRIDAARQTFEFILAENDRFVPALSNLGTILLNQGQEARGIRLLRQAIALDPDYELAWFNLAEYLHRKGRTREAVHTLKEFLRHQPNHETALQALQALS